MAPFRFRLARVLEWYRKQCQVEEENLRLCSARAERAKAAIERHQREVFARQMELIQSPAIQALELAALGSYRRGAKRQEDRLRQDCLACERALERQRGVVLAAQRRLRYVETLRDRRLSEHRYEVDRELEQLASETHLAAFARSRADSGPRP